MFLCLKVLLSYLEKISILPFDYKYSVVILAAGTSSRFGKNKAFLKYNSEHTFLEKIVSTYYNSGIKDGYLVVNNETFNDLKNYKFQNFKIIINSEPQNGRLYSLKLAVEKMDNYNYCFIQNIDNPFVNPDLIQKLITNCENCDYIVPTFDGKNGHPALISSKVLKLISKSDYSFGIKEVLKQFAKKNVIVNDKSVLYNINTIEEYKSIFKFVE